MINLAHNIFHSHVCKVFPLLFHALTAALRIYYSQNYQFQLPTNSHGHLSGDSLHNYGDLVFCLEVA